MNDTPSIALLDPVGQMAGMDYYDWSLVKALANRGVMCHLFSNFTPSSQVAQVSTYSVYPNLGKSKWRKGIHLLLGHWKTFRSCKKMGIQQVLLHAFHYRPLDYLTYWLAHRFGLKIAVIAHDIESFGSGDRQALKEKILCKMASVVFVHNQFSRKTLQANLPQLPASKVQVMPHGDYFDCISKIPEQAAAREQLGWQPETHYLLFFGLIKQVKGLDILLEAMPDFPANTHLIIAGRPWKEDFSRYSELIQKKGLQNRVTCLLHYIDDAKRDLLFKASNMLIAPYKHIYQSGTILMAMSYGLPVVTSDLEPNKEFINDGQNGSLFESKNPDDLARAVSQLFEQPELSSQYAINSVETIRQQNSWSLAAKVIHENFLTTS